LALDDAQNTEQRRPTPGRGQTLLGVGGGPPLGPGAEQLLHVYRLSEPALSELSLDPLLDELLARAKEILAVDTAAILLLDEDDDELVARAAKGLEEEVERGVRVPVGRGFAGRIAAERAPIFIADVDHADVLNPILRAKGVRSLLGVPLIVQGRVIGVLHVGTLTPREFTDGDAVLLQVVAAQAGPAIERIRLFDALDREHRGGIALQRSLLPEGLPDIVGVDVAARYLPALDEVGGDWYDVIELSRGRVGIAIGDVAGHGVRAAALMGQLRTGLRAYALEGHAPGETLKRLDRLMHTIRGRGMATAGYALFDPTTGRLRHASAGHPPPVLVTASGEARVLEVKSAPPLGTLPFPTYLEVETTIAPGDAILMYTDGLIERRREPLTAGLERLRATVSVKTTAEGLCERTVATLVPGGAAQDDVALVALRNRPVAPELQLRFPAIPQVLADIRQVLRRWLYAQGARPDEIAALTLAGGEACANAIEHAYAPGPASFELETAHAAGVVTLAVRDAGRWRAPRRGHRGRGLKMIEAAVDELDVSSTASGTEIRMRRRLGS
jgi:anti-sigma regulatory factor (Ser/Thr protein kinase)/putative methionine-R-sulfoxide reductase with GAF domain